jgi:uncharacterized protein YceK
MIRLLPILAVLLLTGCGSVRVLNAGAQGPWRVTMSNCDQVQADYQGTEKNVIGFCDYQQQELRLPFDKTRAVIAAVAMHELGHKIERDYPRIWVELDAMDTADFPCGSDDLHLAQRIAAKAAQENK